MSRHLNSESELKKNLFNLVLKPKIFVAVISVESFELTCTALFLLARSLSCFEYVTVRVINNLRVVNAVLRDSY